MLPHVISEDQTGFITGRFIKENIRLIDSIIKYAEEENIVGLLFFLDFEKAFNTLEWSFVHKALKSLGFSSKSLKWILFSTPILKAAFYTMAGQAIFPNSVKEFSMAAQCIRIYLSNQLK